MNLKVGRVSPLRAAGSHGRDGAHGVTRPTQLRFRGSKREKMISGNSLPGPLLHPTEEREKFPHFPPCLFLIQRQWAGGLCYPASTLKTRSEQFDRKATLQPSRKLFAISPLSGRL